MSRIRQLIELLRSRPDVAFVEQEQSWLVIITKGRDMICEVSIGQTGWIMLDTMTARRRSLRQRWLTIFSLSLTACRHQIWCCHSESMKRGPNNRTQRPPR